MPLLGAPGAVFRWLSRSALLTGTGAEANNSLRLRSANALV